MQRIPAGNWIAVAIRAGQSGQSFTVSDTRANTYRKAVQLNETVDGTSLALYYAESIAGGANTVTVASSISGGTLRFAIFEYAGVAGTDSLDAVASARVRVRAQQWHGDDDGERGSRPRRARDGQSGDADGGERLCDSGTRARVAQHQAGD